MLPLLSYIASGQKEGDSLCHSIECIKQVVQNSWSIWDNIWFSTNFIKNQSPADHSRMKPWLYIPMAWVYFFSKQTSSSATTQTWIRPKELMLNVVGNLLSFSVHLVDLWCKGDHITRSSALNPTAPLLARCKFVYIYIFCLHIYYFFAYHEVNLHCLAIMIST